MDEDFLKVKRKLLSDIEASRTTMPERTIVITLRHPINGREFTEQLTLTEEEFEEIVKVIKWLLERIEKIEEEKCKLPLANARGFAP